MDILQKYYESKLALEILSAEVEEQKRQVTEYLLTLPDHKAEIAGMARFHIKRDFVYEFSEKTREISLKTSEIVSVFKKKIKDAQSVVKQSEAMEIEDGTAKLIETTYAPVLTPLNKTVKGGEK
jgi:hypothetical protein